MRILFAAPDRDLLSCYKEILESECDEVVTVFDGTQVLSLLSTELFDIMILDRSIPRIGYKELTALAQEKKIPVIILTDEPGGMPSNAYLTYPFTPDQIESVIRETGDKK